MKARAVKVILKLSNTPDPYRVVKLVRVRNGSRILVTVCQFATCWPSSIVSRTYTNVYGVIIMLERGILLHFFRLFICRLVCESSRPVTNRHSFGRPVTHRVYWTCMLYFYYPRCLKTLSSCTRPGVNAGL